MQVETTTRPATHAHIGTRRANAAALLTQADLAKPRREDGSVVAVEPDLGGGGRELLDHVPGDGRATGEALERGRVRLGDPVDAMLALDELACPLAHCRTHRRIGERLE